MIVDYLLFEEYWHRYFWGGRNGFKLVIIFCFFNVIIVFTLCFSIFDELRRVNFGLVFTLGSSKLFIFYVLEPS